MGAVLSIFNNGIDIISITLWLSPIFLLRFSRSQNIIKGTLLIFIAMIIAQTIAHWQIIPVPKAYAIISLGFGFFSTLSIIIPILLDKILYPRFKGILATLVFPVAAVSLFSIQPLIRSTGPSPVLSYIEYNNLQLQQFGSILGIWGVAFIILWFASLFNWCWEKKFNFSEIKKPAIIYILIFLCILLYGGFRNVIGYPQINTVRTASITIPKENSIPFDKYEYILKNKIALPVEENIHMITRLTAKAADAGAKIVAWQEYSVLLNKKDENKFLNKCAELALNQNIYLIISYIVFNKNDLSENKAIFIDNAGKVEIHYFKHFLAVGENRFVKKGEGNLPVIKTPFGNIGLVICRDISNTHYIHQAGKNSVDILFLPALGWKEIHPGFTQTTTITAIENGFSLVTASGNALSLAVDYHGRTLSSMDYFTSNNGIMYADVPVKGVKTIYARIGYLFPWLCVIGLIAFIVVSIVMVKK